MKPISDISKKIVTGIEKVLWVLGLHAFGIILLLIFIDFILGGFIFYKYVFLAEKAEPKITETILKFNDKKYQSVMAELQARECGGECLPMPALPQ
jgi:hypothetical protein